MRNIQIFSDRSDPIILLTSRNENERLQERIKLSKKHTHEQMLFERKLFVCLSVGAVITVLCLNFLQSLHDKKQQERIDKTEKILLQQSKEFKRFKTDLGFDVNGLRQVDDEILERLDGLEMNFKKQNIYIHKSPYTKKTSKPVILANALMARGFTGSEASAIVGNIVAESSMNPRATDGKAVGLMQWQDGRLHKLKKFAGARDKNHHDMNIQLDYIAWELRGGNKKETKNFEKAIRHGNGDIKKTAFYVAKYVERPAGWALEQSKNKRMNVALNTYRQLTKEIV